MNYNTIYENESYERHLSLAYSVGSANLNADYI